VAKKYPFQLLVAFLLFLFLVIASIFSTKIGEGKFYVFLEWIDPIIGFFTFTFAFFIWMLQIKRDWKSELSKRMTVIFEHDNKNILECKEAFLSGESDIRAWAQQIGMQMTGGIRLNFHPFPRMQKSSIEYDKVLKEFYQHYVVVFQLSSLPSKMLPNSNKLDAFSKRISKGEVLLWERQTTIDRKIYLHETWKVGSKKIG